MQGLLGRALRCVVGALAASSALAQTCECTPDDRKFLDLLDVSRGLPARSTEVRLAATTSDVLNCAAAGGSVCRVPIVVDAVGQACTAAPAYCKVCVDGKVQKAVNFYLAKRVSAGKYQPLVPGDGFAFVDGDDPRGLEIWRAFSGGVRYFRRAAQQPSNGKQEFVWVPNRRTTQIKAPPVGGLLYEANVRKSGTSGDTGLCRPVDPIIVNVAD